MRELRNSLRPTYESFSFARAPIRLSTINPADCSLLRGRERRECDRAVQPPRR